MERGGRYGPELQQVPNYACDPLRTDDCIRERRNKEKLEVLAQWVSSWMYGVIPIITMPAGMPRPGVCAAPQRVRILVRVPLSALANKIHTNQSQPHLPITVTYT